jgi:hypothetical protein
MSGIHLVASELDLEGSPQRFSDLLKHLKSGLEKSQTPSDLEELMTRLAEHLKIKSYSSDQKRDLRSLRQKGYDRRAKLRKLSSEDLATGLLSEPDIFQAIRSKEGLSEEIESSKRTEEEAKVAVLDISEVQNQNQSTIPQAPPLEGFKQAVASLDGVQLARMLPKLVVLLSASMLVGWFLWLQSVELYSASGFSNAGLVAFGGLVMVVGFAGFHSVYRSKLALLCCLYAGGYEAYFIVSGTFSDEMKSKVADKVVSEKMAWHQEQLDRAKKDYGRVESRYEDPSDKVYQNPWYKKNHVTPAWVAYSRAQQVMEKQQQWIKHEVATFDHTGWLKIFFRMGLVVLFMLMVHQIGSLFSSPKAAPD